LEKNWHVIYTRSRAEKAVYSELIQKDIEAYLPVRKTLRQWKDRKKWVELPLITGYCFVKINRKDYDMVLQTDNVVSYVRFEGKAAVIPESQINALRKMLQQNDLEINVSTENFEPGQMVEIITGPLIGLRGELVQSRGKHKFIIRILPLQSSLTIEISDEHLTRIPGEQ
jgi:transcription antitermination factor NusG